ARQGEGHTEVAPEIEAAIERQRGGGQALDNGVRGQMESAFGVDFSRVNIHADNASDLLNRSLEARAFTVGSDIFFRVHTDAKAAKSAAEMNAEVYTVKHNIVFATGRYAPDTQPGRQLLAHELTHSLQQSETHFQVQRQKGGGSSTPARSSSRPLHIGEYVIVPDPKNRPSEWAPLSGYSEVRGGEILDVWFDGSNYFFYVENHGNKLKYCLPSNWFRSTRLKKAKYCGLTCPQEVMVSCFDSSFGMNLPAPRGWDRKNLTKAKKQCLEFL
ncbi:MAG: DUF4157 domain-containing protein, partial [Cyanobacteria bacterium SID2]|nr:DUF4157 domain-containing protein [Cyanobacteria bacterium SID2]